MGRPRTIYVDHDKLLFAIHVHYEADLAELLKAQAATLAVPGYCPFGRSWELTCLRQTGLQIDFERFASRALTSSERARWQEALRKLEADDLVSVYGLKATRVAVTAAGLDHLRDVGLLPPESAPTTPEPQADA